MKKTVDESYKVQLIRVIEQGVVELKDKIQMGSVDEKTLVPYAAISIIEDEPIYTCNGIAGNKTVVDITVCASSPNSVDLLKDKIIISLNFIDIFQRRCYFIGSEYTYYSEHNVHGYTLTFKLI